MLLTLLSFRPFSYNSTPSDSQYKQGLDYSEYKQGLADIASKGPLGHGRRRTLLAYDQISHWRHEKKKSFHRGGWCAIIPWLAFKLPRAPCFRTPSSLPASRCRTSFSLSERLKFSRFCPTEALSASDMSRQQMGTRLTGAPKVGW